MIGTVELVALAIQAGVRLARTGRRIYVENTISRAITIPLPAGFESPTARARLFADRLSREDPAAFAARYTVAMQAEEDATTREEKRLAALQLVQIYLLDVGRGLVPMASHVPRDVAGLVAVKQWEDDESPFPHPLQRVAGALVEIAIDYFLHVPGALDTDSKHGRAVRALLDGLDDFDFQEARWDAIVIALFTTGLETLGDRPGLVTGDADRQAVVASLVRGVAGDLQARLEALPPEGDLDAEDRMREVGTTLLRSLLRNGGEIVATNPELVGIRGEPAGAFFGQTFSALMDVLVADSGPLDLGASLRRLASSEGMDRLISAALLAGSEHPEVFGIADTAVREWLQKVLRGLYEGHADGGTFFDTDLFPEIASLALLHGASDLPRFVDLGADAQAVTVLVAREVYDLLADPPSDDRPARWRLALARSDVASVFEDVLGAVATSPAWAIDMAEEHERVAALARVALEVVIDVGEGGFKELLRGGALEPLVVAALETGLAQQLESADRARLAHLVGTVRDVLRAHGSSGLPATVESGAVRDLLAAVVESEVLGVLVGDDAGRAEAGVEAAVSILDQLRTGEVLTVPEMADRLRRVA